MLCFDNEPIAKDPNLSKWVSCVFFDGKGKRYAVYAQDQSINVEGLKPLYKKFAKDSDTTIQATATDKQNGGFLVKDYGQFQMLAQMTTGDSRELYFEVVLDLDFYGIYYRNLSGHYRNNISKNLLFHMLGGGRSQNT